MNAATALKRLRSLRNQFGEAAQRELRALLRAMPTLRMRKWREVAALHDDLLFLCAFPASVAMRRDARRLLQSIAQRMAALPSRERQRGDDTGIAGSVTRHVLPFAVARSLAPTQQAEIDWRNVADETDLDAVVRPLLAPAAAEAFDSGEYGTREFVALARPAHARSDLQWLTSEPGVADDWDSAEVPIVWQLGNSPECVTHNVVPNVPLVVRHDLRRPEADVRAQIETPLASIELLPRKRASQVIGCARSALAARCREVNAMTYPNRDEVWWCDLDCGVALAVIGIARQHRLALETNTGYVVFAGGVPIGYGGVTPLFRQANTGINVFDPFRGSEAAFLWVQMLRAFHTLYGSERFVINAYQFGAGNVEAIRSGAFWFYYRLGFRPASSAVRALAAREAKRIAADRRYRSDATTLRSLASGDLHLDLARFDPADQFDETLLPRAGARAARQLAAAAPSRRAAQRKVGNALADVLGVTDYARWTRDERRGFEFLAPIFAKLPDADTWSASDREALASLLRAKGLPQERAFALRSTRATRAWKSLGQALTCTSSRDRGTPGA